MLVDTVLAFDQKPPDPTIEEIEAAGYDGAWAAESSHDPLLALAVAAGSSTHLSLGTSILVAFGRSPMVTAIAANDVQILSRGRLMLGLGSQVKPHIEKRYSMPWSRPADRMREYILALRSIWTAWNEDSELEFRGEFYTHTLMTPFFRPDPHGYGMPKIFLAGVGDRMTEIAGEVADGFLVHPFTTERYLRQVTLPAIERGLERAGRSRDNVQISYAGLVVTGASDKEYELATSRVRSRIAFYGSTPAYRAVLEMHGWGDLHAELHALSTRGEWRTMKHLIDDDVLRAFSIVAPVKETAREVLRRYGDAVDRFTLGFATDLDPHARAEISKGLQAPTGVTP